MTHESNGGDSAVDFLDDLSAMDFALLLDVMEESSANTALASTDGVASPEEQEMWLFDASDRVQSTETDSNVPADAQRNGQSVETVPVIKSETSETAKPVATRSTACRQRQREELEHLREQVRELDVKLRSLQQPTAAADPTNASPSSSPLSSGDSEPTEQEEQTATVVPRVAELWERIAKHQLAAKQRAEKTNRALRQQLEGQLKIARGLEKLLRKRSPYDDDHLAISSNETKRMRRRGRSTEAATVYQQLAEKLEMRYRECAHAYRANGLATHKVAVQDTRVSMDPHTKEPVVEIINSKIFPFDLESTCAAMWKCSTLAYLPLSQGFYSAQSVDNGVLASKFEVVLHVRRQPVTLVVLVAMKRFQELDAHREVYAWDSLSTMHSECKAYDGIQLHDHGWSVIEALPSEDPQGKPLTIVQCCSRLVPDLGSLPLQQQKKNPVGVWNDVLIASYTNNYQVLCETVEGLLLEDALCIGRGGAAMSIAEAQD